MARAGAKHNITIEKGATFSYSLGLTDTAGDPVDLTGYSAEMDIRTSAGNTTEQLTLTEANGRITLGGAAGTIALLINATDTDDITFTAGVYDLKLTSSGGVSDYPLYGDVEIVQTVTR